MKATFFTFFIAITLTHANPVIRQNQVCNTAPAGTGSGNGPFSQPSAATAAACQQQCNANTQCQSFTFGLPNSATAPQCSLFAVAAGQVPSQSDPNIMVFDKACSGVSSTAPTPASTGNSNSANAAGGQGSNNGGNQGNNGNRNTQPRSVNGNTNSRPPTQGNNGNQNPPPSNQGGTTPPPPPTQGRNRGRGRKRSNTCGAAPAGPAGNSPTPIQAVTTIQTQDECLALCKQTSGCQSAEFNRPSPDRLECMLFNTPAANLPPNNEGSAVVFDVGC